MPPIDDTLAARVPDSCPESIAQLLKLSWQHDLAAVKPLLAVPGRASVQEPTTGETPLHAAIRSCAPTNQPADGADEAKQAAVVEAAKAVVHELFMSGAIWNDVDSQDETPGCLAARLGLKPLYEECVQAGVRAELLFGLLDGYEELESEGEEDDEKEEASAAGDDNANENDEKDADEPEDVILESDPDRAFPKKDVNSADYLRSGLTYTAGKLVDAEQNGVMMAWETSIMEESAKALIPSGAKGKRVLNIGFGMGIIDGLLAATQPARHHIIEAHEGVLSHMRSDPSCAFGPAWEASSPAPGAFAVHAGRWQDVVPALLEQGEVYDAVYFDTFGEDYKELQHFFTEHVPGLLADEDSVFSFFNGLGADRRVCYDVYTRVVEMHLGDAGLDVDWRELPVDMQGLEKAGEGEWDGVRRRYWTLDTYRLPICTLMG
ncbi:arginine N-methyltransferase 2 [Xylariomycetidae sp. FL0641]|nr:arginine N-methyltransferase 2 [Xylariomycetidae sp. FL0641]